MRRRHQRSSSSILKRLSGTAALLAVALAVVATAPALGAADVTRSADGKTLTIAFPSNGADDALDIESESASTFLMSEVGQEDVNNPVPSAGSGCSPVVGQPGAVRCSVLALTKLVIDLGDGDDDTLFGTWTLSQIETLQLGGPGVDFLVGTPFFDRLEGGAGGDTLDDRLGGSVLLGGAGSDRFVLGQGDDEVQGGADFDVADFDGAATGVDVTLDDLPGDGPAGDSDNIHSDVEDVVGTVKADHIVGNGEANVLAGDQGADVIEGGGGFDRLEGDSGADRILARDGNASARTATMRTRRFAPEHKTSSGTRSTRTQWPSGSAAIDRVAGPRALRRSRC
jgi:Ca2+-binding RTX toxin-like protein